MNSKFGCALMAAALILASFAAEAVICSSVSLNVCLPAIVTADPPSAECCRRALEQRPCYCEFLRDPNLKQFFSNSADRKVSKACRLPYPVCSY